MKKAVDNLRLYQIELAVEKKVISDIRERQKKIPGLKQDELKYTAIWGDGDLTPGCKNCCLKGKWTQIRTTTKCNLNCSFCYYFGQKDALSREMIPKDLYMIQPESPLLSQDDVKLLFEIQGKKFLNGAAWLHFEPLMEKDKIFPLMKFIHGRGYHQWLYTNGILANEDTLKKLSNSGLDEIRFNLAATDCSDQVIKNMKIARKYFKYLCIESPMFTKFYNSFIKKRKQILDTGVDHIHFAELQLFPKTIANLRQEGPIYRYKKGYVSPIKSRQLTYDVFEVAVKEKWKNVVLHDCSNETKFYRGINFYSEDSTFGRIDYAGYTKLDSSFYQQALLRADLWNAQKDEKQKL
ncbi:MAG: radical SAM protein [Candidatus Omnitrophica bacterium]|nr:radical SAM protein [Candidatus Omnitrophota bacterium]